MARFKTLQVYAAAGLLCALSGCGSSDDTADNGDGTMMPGESTPDIVDTAVSADGFDSLVAAVQKAGLVDTLKSEGPFTVFAPTDAAFAAALESLGVTLDDLTAEDLVPILTYHVVAGELYAADVVNATSATTVQGSAVSIAVVDGGVVLNGSVNVVSTDIVAGNGVIHVIDGVLLPPAE